MVEDEDEPEKESEDISMQERSLPPKVNGVKHGA